MKLIDLFRKLTERMKWRRRCLKTTCECLKLAVFLNRCTLFGFPQTAVPKEFGSWRVFYRGYPAPPLDGSQRKSRSCFSFQEFDNAMT